MIICDKCFTDKEIQAIICKGVNGIEHGHCPTCGMDNAVLYDTEKRDELTSCFDVLADLYTMGDELPSDFPEMEKRQFVDDVIRRWKIFSLSGEGHAKEILQALCKDRYEHDSQFFEQSVGIRELFDVGYLERHSLFSMEQWEDFVKEIKTENRYHAKSINLDVLKNLCRNLRKSLKKGSTLYRARISTKDGFSVDEMSAPAPGTSSEGRANASGIVCLYLSGDNLTPIYEVRAGAFDYISIGKFELLRDINIVNLREVETLSPFQGGDMLDYIVNKDPLIQLDNEMSKALRRDDSKLDYVPTQYIVDYIKSITDEEGKHLYDGVEYKSTLKRNGCNFAMFNPDVFKCVSVNTYCVKELSYVTDPRV